MKTLSSDKIYSFIITDEFNNYRMKACHDIVKSIIQNIIQNVELCTCDKILLFIFNFYYFRLLLKILYKIISLI